MNVFGYGYYERVCCTLFRLDIISKFISHHPCVSTSARFYCYFVLICVYFSLSPVRSSVSAYIRLHCIARDELRNRHSGFTAFIDNPAGLSLCMCKPVECCYRGDRKRERHFPKPTSNSFSPLQIVCCSVVSHVYIRFYLYIQQNNNEIGTCSRGRVILRSVAFSRASF